MERVDCDAVKEEINEQHKLIRNTLLVGSILAVVLPIIFGALSSLFIFYGESLGIAFAATIIASEMATAAIVFLSMLPFVLVIAVVFIAILVLGIKIYANKKLLKKIELERERADKSTSDKKDESKKVNKLDFSRFSEDFNENDEIPERVKEVLDDLFGGKVTVNKIPFCGEVTTFDQEFEFPIFKGLYVKNDEAVPFILVRMRCESSKEDVLKKHDAFKKREMARAEGFVWRGFKDKCEMKIKEEFRKEFEEKSKEEFEAKFQEEFEKKFQKEFEKILTVTVKEEMRKSAYKKALKIVGEELEKSVNFILMTKGNDDMGFEWKVVSYKVEKFYDWQQMYYGDNCKVYPDFFSENLTQILPTGNFKRNPEDEKLFKALFSNPDLKGKDKKGLIWKIDFKELKS
jgi:hypothetical protein